MRQRPPPGKVCGEASAGSRAGAPRPSAASACSPGRRACGAGRRSRAVLLFDMSDEVRGSWVRGGAGLGCTPVRRRSGAPVPAYGSGARHGRSRTLPTFGSPDPDQLDGLRELLQRQLVRDQRQRIEQPGPEDPHRVRPGLRRRAEHGVHLQLPYDEIGRVEPVGARRRDPGQDQPPAAPQQAAGGRRAAARGPGGLDDDVEVVRERLGPRLRKSVAPNCRASSARSGPRVRPRAARPASPPSGTERRTCPSVPAPDDGDPLTRHGRPP